MIWAAVLIGSAISYVLKLSGYLVPARWVEHPRVLAVAALLPAALLGALVIVQTFASGKHLTLDARAVGVVVAGVAFWRRAPFIVAVVLAAVAAASLRALGWG